MITNKRAAERENQKREIDDVTNKEDLEILARAYKRFFRMGGVITEAEQRYSQMRRSLRMGRKVDGC